MTMQKLNPTAQGWHNAEWSTWGWIETILKLVGIAAGLLAFAQTPASNGLVIGGNPRLLAVALLALMTLGLMATVFIRYVQRESLSFGFAIVNALGHLGLLIALLRVPPPMTLAVVFGLFFVLGQAAKLRFLSLTGYTEGGADLRQMKRVAAVVGLVYVAFTVFLLV